MTAHLDTAHSPGIDRRNIVDIYSHARVVLDIPPFPTLSEIVTADVNRIGVRAMAGTHWHDMRLTVRPDDGDAFKC